MYVTSQFDDNMVLFLDLDTGKYCVKLWLFVICSCEWKSIDVFPAGRGSGIKLGEDVCSWGLGSLSSVVTFHYFVDNRR